MSEGLANCDQETLCGRDVPKLNEAALAMVLADVNFIELEIQRLNRPGLDHVFDEVKLVSKHLASVANWFQTINVILSDAVNAYMEPSIRQLSYSAIKPARLATILAKLSAGSQAAGIYSKAERRREESAQVARLR